MVILIVLILPIKFPCRYLKRDVFQSLSDFFEHKVSLFLRFDRDQLRQLKTCQLQALRAFIHMITIAIATILILIVLCLIVILSCY